MPLSGLPGRRGCPWRAKRFWPASPVVSTSALKSSIFHGPAPHVPVVGSRTYEIRRSGNIRSTVEGLSGSCRVHAGRTRRYRGAFGPCRQRTRTRRSTTSAVRHRARTVGGPGPHRRRPGHPDRTGARPAKRNRGRGIAGRRVALAADGADRPRGRTADGSGLARRACDTPHHADRSGWCGQDPPGPRTRARDFREPVRRAWCSCRSPPFTTPASSGPPLPSRSACRTSPNSICPGESGWRATHSRRCWCSTIASTSWTRRRSSPNSSARRHRFAC